MAGGLLDTIGATPTADSPALSFAQLVALAQKVGLPADRARIAAAVALAESSGRPRALNPNGCDQSYGPWQINMVEGRPGCDQLGPGRRAAYGITSNDALFDPLTNAKAMAKISGGGQNFGAWTTFTSGKYKAYLGGGGGSTVGGAAGDSSSPSATPVDYGSTDPNESGCLIGEITMPSVIPNIPCLFYKSWGWAILGGAALIAGGGVMIVGALLIAGRSKTVQQATGMVTGMATGGASTAAGAATKAPTTAARTGGTTVDRATAAAAARQVPRGMPIAPEDVSLYQGGGRPSLTQGERQGERQAQRERIHREAATRRAGAARTREEPF